MTLEGWNHIPRGYGADFDVATAPWWLRLWFRTPEGWKERDGKWEFRASMYMRPLAVWAIQAALSAKERR